MDKFDAVQELMALTFGVPSSAITPETIQADVPEWDSVANLNLMLALEDAFGITLGVDDMARLTSVRAMLDYLETACPSS